MGGLICNGGNMAKKFNIKDLKKNEDGKFILPLNSPFKYGEREVKELLLDEPRAKHIRQMPSNPKMDDIMNVIAVLAGEPDSLIDELSMGDITRAGEFFGSFE